MLYVLVITEVLLVGVLIANFFIMRRNVRLHKQGTYLLRQTTEILRDLNRIKGLKDGSVVRFPGQEN